MVNKNEWIEFNGSHTQELILNGIRDVERQKMISNDAKPIDGAAVRLFNPQTKLWNIYWADSKDGNSTGPF